MSNCPNCGAQVAPNSRFCTECGKPLAAAGPAPMPPAPPMVRPPMPGQPMVMPPGMPPVPTGMPPMPPNMRPAPAPMAPMAPMAPAPMPPASVAPAPMAPAPVAPAVPVAQVAAAVAAPVPATGTYKIATIGDLFNNGSPVAILVTEDRLTLLPAGGAPIVEQIPGLRNAIAGDFDGDGTQELAVFTDTQVWVLRFSVHGSVPSGKVTLKETPEFLTRAPFTHDGGRTVLMGVSTEQVVFYVLHPAKGLVEIASIPVPFIEP